eukprot:2658318-Rhodomonas_salina.6
MPGAGVGSTQRGATHVLCDTRYWLRFDRVSCYAFAKRCPVLIGILRYQAFVFGCEGSVHPPSSRSAWAYAWLCLSYASTVYRVSVYQCSRICMSVSVLSIRALPSLPASLYWYCESA